MARRDEEMAEFRWLLETKDVNHFAWERNPNYCAEDCVETLRSAEVSS